MKGLIQSDLAGGQSRGPPLSGLAFSTLSFSLLRGLRPKSVQRCAFTACGSVRLSLIKDISADWY